MYDARSTRFSALRPHRARIALILGLATATALLSQLDVSAQDAAPARAAAVIVDPTGVPIGTAAFSDTGGGTAIMVAVSGLTPGLHGVHLHTNGSCGDSTNDQGQTVVFGGAGSHFDPHESKRHGGPETHSEEGHAGDLPNIAIGEDGRGILQLTTDKVTVSAGELSIAGRSIVIHANEDNYTDEPALGGSGPRVACGVIQALGPQN